MRCEDRLEPGHAAYQAEDGLGQSVMVVCIELVHIEERDGIEVLHPIEEQHQRPRSAGQDVAQRIASASGLLDQHIGHAADGDGPQPHRDAPRILQEILELAYQIVVHYVLGEVLRAVDKSGIDVSVLNGPEIQHPLDEIHQPGENGIRRLIRIVDDESEDGEPPVARIHLQALRIDHAQARCVDAVAIADEHGSSVQLKPLIYNGIRRNLTIGVHDIVRTETELVLEHGIRHSGIAVEVRRCVPLPPIRVQISQGHDDIEQGQTEVGLATAVLPDDQHLVDKTVAYQIRVETVLLGLGEIHDRTAPQPPEILHREFLQHRQPPVIFLQIV